MQHPMTTARLCAGALPQLAVSSHRETPEARASHRDRSRSRKRERLLGRPRSSRSRSPKEHPSKPRFRRPSTDPEMHPLSACPICLSRKRHPIRKCQALSIWDGQHKSRCSRSADGRIIDGEGHTLCSNWNQTIGCTDKSSRHIHECSGCGESSHGTQGCPLTEKA